MRTRIGRWQCLCLKWIMRIEYQSRFGLSRAYGVQTMRYDVIELYVKGVYTQILEETDEGMVVVDGTERLASGFSNAVNWLVVLKQRSPCLDIQTERNKISS